MSDSIENNSDSWEPLVDIGLGNQHDNYNTNNKDKNGNEGDCEHNYQTNNITQIQTNMSSTSVDELNSPFIPQVDTLYTDVIEENKNTKLSDSLTMKRDKDVGRKLFGSDKIILSKQKRKQYSITTNNDNDTNSSNNDDFNEKEMTSTVTSDNVITRDLLINDSIINDKDENSIEEEVQSPSFLNNMFATFKSSSTSVDNISTKLPSDSNHKNQTVSSPSIISHRRDNSISSKRKSSRTRKTSNDSSLFNLVNSPLQKVPQPVEIITHMHSNNSSHKDLNQTDNKPQTDIQGLQDSNEMDTVMVENSNNKPNEENYNKKKFVEEKYSDTDYHYATVERDLEFHNLFESIPNDDRLIDDFSCALSRDFLYQGRLYISEKNLCFNSNILGWVSKDIIPMKDIRYLEKTSAAGLFPNAILIETDNEKVQFNNFLSREQTFNLIKEVWSKNLIFADFDKDTVSSKNQNKVFQDDKETFNDDVYHDDSSISSVSINEKIGETSVGHYQFKEGANYVNEPPYTHNETSFPEYTEPNEYILKTIDLPCTPLQAYQIMYSDQNYSFLYDYLHSVDSSDIEEPTKYDKLNRRTYSFEKRLNIPGGPKSTRCYAEETIMNYDSHGYIMVLTTTRTPNVTSGKAFSTKTKYMYRWGPKNNCQMQISYWLEWTGSSWFKKMIEAGAKKGQTEASEKLIETLNDYIKNNIIETDESITYTRDFIESSPIVKMVSIKNDLEKNIAKIDRSKAISTNSIFLSQSSFIFFIIVFTILLTINIWNQISMRKTLSNIERLLEMERLSYKSTMNN